MCEHLVSTTSEGCLYSLLQMSPIHLAKHNKNIVMMAKIDELPSESCKDNILIANKISALSFIEYKTHTVYGS